MKNDKINFEKKLAKKFGIISLIIIILILLFTINRYFDSGSIDGSSLSGFAILIPFFLIPESLIFIWGLYIFIILVNWIRKNKIRMLVFLSILLFVGILNFYKQSEGILYDVNKVFEYMGANKDFIINGDKLYYNVWETNSSPSLISNLLDSLTDNYVKQDSINSMNLSGNENKILCKNLEKDYDDVVDKKFLFIKKNELYYTQADDASNSDSYINKKINLNNCKITNLLNGYILTKPNYNDEYVYGYNNSGYTTNTDNVLVRYNIDKNKIDKKIIINENINENSLLIDYINFNIYYTTHDGELYINEEKILEYPYEEYQSSLETFLYTDSYLFYYIDNKIYRLNINTKEVEELKGITYKNIRKIQSDTNDTYFMADNNIYIYNEEKNKFEKIYIGNSDYNNYTEAHHFGNKIIFDYDNRGGSILIYEKEKKLFEEHKYALYNYDNVSNNLYLIYKNKEFDENTIIKKIN